TGLNSLGTRGAIGPFAYKNQHADAKNMSNNTNQAEVKKSSETTNGTRFLGPGISLRDDGTLCYRGVPVGELKAFTIPLFAKLVCRSRQSLWKEITLGRLRVRNRLISRAAGDEWLNGTGTESETRR